MSASVDPKASEIVEMTEEEFYHQHELLVEAERHDTALDICSGCWKANWQCDGKHEAEST